MPTFATIKGLHHFAYKCRDAEETRAFYEDLLGLPLHHYTANDVVPVTGEYCPHLHIFFRLGDGSSVAFFDLGDGQAAIPSPNTPGWANYLSLAVDSVSDLERVKCKLQAAGVDVIGPTDHGLYKSVCFHDPNGIRIELAADEAKQPEFRLRAARARQHLDEWMRSRNATHTESGASSDVREPAEFAQRA